MSRTTGRCVGVAVAALPVDLEEHGHLAETESRRLRVSTEAGNAPHFGDAGDAIAYLDALAAQMRACGWTAYVNTPPGRLPSLFLRDPHNPAVWADIVAAPDSDTDNWWYWFSWAERITAVYTPDAAAIAIIATLRLAVDSQDA